MSRSSVVLENPRIVELLNEVVSSRTRKTGAVARAVIAAAEASGDLGKGDLRHLHFDEPVGSSQRA